jgi:2'-5' RNA ligase
MFVAIEVEESVREKLVVIQEQLAKTGADLKLVEPENVHVTMKFLGEVPEEKTGAIADALKRAAAGTGGFEAKVKGIDVFPGLNYIRVVWAGVAEGGEKFIELQRKIERELQPLGFRPEKDFVPHLTLARVRTARGRDRLVAFVKEKEAEEFGATQVKAVELKQSTLTPSGPVYRTLARVELG